MQLSAADDIGSLEVGKKADLIMLDDDVFELTPHEIHKARVALTMVDGRIVHEGPTVVARQ